MIAAAAVPLCTAVTAGGCTYAAEAPTDIHLTVQTKEIDIEDIPADRVVTLDIYQENCPAFDAMMIPIVKDPRLSFYPEYSCFKLADGVRNARRPNIGYDSSDPDYRLCDLCSSIGNDDLIEFDNAIVTVSVKLPDQVSPGDFYGVEMQGAYNNAHIQIAVGDEMSDVFNESAFSQLNGGGILITQREQPAPVPEGNGSVGGQSAGESGGGGQGGGEAQSPAEEPQSGDSNNAHEAAPASTTASTSVTAAVTAVTTNTTTISATQSTSTTSEKTTTESTTVTSLHSTAAEIATGAPEENEKKSKGGFITIALITLIVVAVASTALLAEKLRMNRK